MTMRITTQMVDNSNLARINDDLAQLDETQESLSTGFKINQASDDPYGESQALSINGQVNQYKAYTASINTATSWTQSSTAAMQSIQSVINSMQTLATEGANGTMNSSDLADAATEVMQYIGEVKQSADTQYDGSYVFSGSATNTAPYDEDASGSDAYQGNSDSINYAIGPGTTLAVNSDLHSVLGDGVSGDGGLLSTMRAIYNDMTGTNGGTQSDLGNQITALQSNLSSLEVVQASTGATTDRLTMASTRIESLSETDQTELGDIEDTDVAQATLTYSTQQAAYQAALQSTANILQTSLMNYLQS